MRDKIKEAKLAIIERITNNVKAADKPLNADTINIFSNIVDMFDKTEMHTLAKDKKEYKDNEVDEV